MSSFDKSNDLCRSHSSKSDRDMYRICPSKLSKRELEDLYFTVLENNVELKKTVNAQLDKIRFLSTKVQRITLAQKNAQSKETKECCGASKAVINQQLLSINNLNKQNERLTERIKVLNMQLCSAKQFVKRNPYQIGRTTGLRNSASSPKQSAVVLKSVSCQNLDRPAVNMKSVETETETNQSKQDVQTRTSCEENKCQTLMDELKQKIFTLEEELAHTHTEYSSRLSRLEREVTDLREDNTRVCAERVLSDHRAQRYSNKVDALAHKLRTSEDHCADLEMKLAVESRRVAELETRVKLSDVSDKLNKTIVDKLTAMNERRHEPLVYNDHITPSTTLGTATAYTKLIKDIQPVTPYLETVSPKLDVHSPERLNQKSALTPPERIDEMSPTFDIYEPKIDDSTKVIDTTIKPVDEAQVQNISPLVSPILDCKLHDRKIDSSPDDKMSKSSDDSGYAGSSKAQRNHNKKEVLKTNEELLKKINSLQKDLDCLKKETMAKTQTDKSEISPNDGNAELSIPQQVMKRAQEIFATVEPPDSKANLNPEPNICSTPRNSKDIKKLQIPLSNNDAETSMNNENENENAVPQNRVIGNYHNENNDNANNDNADNNNANNDNVVQKRVKSDSADYPENFRRPETPRRPDHIHHEGTNKYPTPPIVDCLLKHSSTINTAIESTEYVYSGESQGNEISNESPDNKKVSNHVLRQSMPKVSATSIMSIMSHTVYVNKDDPCDLCEGCIYHQECKQGTNIHSQCENKRNCYNNKTSKKKEDTQKYIETDQVPLSAHFSQFPYFQSKSKDNKKNRDVKYLESQIKADGQERNTLKVPSSHKILRSNESSKEVKQNKNIEEMLDTLRNSENPSNFRNTDMPKIDENPTYTKIATDYPAVRRELKTYRRPSGTLCFSTSPGQPSSSARNYSFGATEKQMPARSRRLSTSEKGTYTLDSQKTRATSPDDGTDYEISSITDSPREKYAKTQIARSLSPGECTRDKVMSTYTDTSTSTTDNMTLSEGECQFSVRNPAKTNRDIENKKNCTQKMEEALSSIAQELSRCKQLLQQTRQDSVEYNQPAEAKPMGIELRPSTAQQNISDSYAPYCTFTLHIGTVVFSDEAMLYSSKKDLVLTWKFYDQNVAMSRMPGGRVMLFDCSTEYTVKVTEEFLEYMRHDEMPILICECEKPSEPFAGCSLPLRDALLHTNRRTDMSLALLAGVELQQARQNLCAKHVGGGGGGGGGCGDEVGVLDLWCVLTARGHALPALSRAGGRQQIDEERRDEADLDYPMFNINTNSRPPLARRTHAWGSSTMQLPSTSNALNDKNEKNITPAKNYNTLKIDEEDDVELPTKIKPSKDIKQDVEDTTLAKRSSLNSMRDILLQRKPYPKENHSSKQKSENESNGKKSNNASNPKESIPGKPNGLTEMMKFRNRGPIKTDQSKKSVTIDTSKHRNDYTIREAPQKDSTTHNMTRPSINITVLWLALNEECDAMVNPYVQRLFIAYTFLGRSGAELETPISLPKPKHYVDKCFFNFKKTFYIEDSEVPLLGHLGQGHASSRAPSPANCIVFTVVSEPHEDPLGLENCQDIGYAYLYLGDLLEYSAGSTSYTEVVPVRCGGAVCGVLAVRIDGLDVVHHCVRLTTQH